MDRRAFVQMSLLAASSRPVLAKKPTANGFSVVEMSVVELQAALTAGSLTSHALAAGYLARIKAIDKSGPRINSVIELNPQGLEVARALDEERKMKGPRGPLHGMTVLLKDNVATADNMSTTAGSLALVGAKAPRDAFLVSRLRQAGAVMLGKTNLSEWANLRSTRSTSGWSGRGGLTKNPYALDRNCSGSSSGTGAAIAASLATLGIGTETDGSIISPASICGLVGLKPTVGLVSRDGIVPLSHSQDTAGPMTRTVADAAALLTVIAGKDARDAATLGQPEIPDYSTFLDVDGLRGARLGVVKGAMASNRRVQVLFEAALEVLKAKGAVLIDVELPSASKYADSETEVLLYEFKADLNAYLAEFAVGAPVKTLKDIIAFNEKNRTLEMPYFDQELFIQAEAKGPLTSPEYVAALAQNKKFSRTEGIDAVMKKHSLDALCGLSSSQAWLTDFLNADHFSDSFTTPAAVAGYPHITVPSGFYGGLPIGISFVAGAYAEPMLFKLAYGFEQATKHRKPPRFLEHAEVK
jgi:amidase